LIALNVGLQAGLINQRLFTVLVLMALLTTLMTGPLLSVIRPARASLPTLIAKPAAPASGRPRESVTQTSRS
jgi:hypothetical protein